MQSTVALFMLQSRPAPQMLGTQPVAEAPGSTFLGQVVPGCFTNQDCSRVVIVTVTVALLITTYANTSAQHTAIHEMTVIHGI